MPFLHDKDPAFIEAVAPHMNLVKVDKDDYVVTEGERGTDLFFVLGGEVHCEYETDDGRKHTLMKYSPGHYFGDVAMFILEKNIVSFKATKVARTNSQSKVDGQCELYMLPRHILLNVALQGSNHAEVKLEMQKLAAEKMRLLSEQIEKVDAWAAEEALTRDGGGTAVSFSEGAQQSSALRTDSGRGRVLSRVLDAADAELADHKAAFQGGSK